MIWSNIASLGFALFLIRNSLLYVVIEPGHIYLLYMGAYVAMIQPLTTWIFSWKNFNSVSSLLHESSWFKILRTLTFIMVPFALIVLYLVACGNSTKATLHGYHHPFDTATFIKLNQRASNFVKIAYHFGFSCNLVTLVVMSGTIVQLKRIQKKFAQQESM